MNPEELKKVYARKAAETYRKKDGYDWQSALWCSRIVGKYERGATLGLAKEMGVSTDTLEDRAHAYQLFEKLCQLDGGKFRLFVFHARRAPYIYMAHFRALYDLQITYNLSDALVLDLLMDVVQGEGDLSSRNLDDHIRSKYGDSRDWTFYAQRTQKVLVQLMGQPDFPQEGRRRAQDLFSYLGDEA